MDFAVPDSANSCNKKPEKIVTYRRKAVYRIATKGDCATKVAHEPLFYDRLSLLLRACLLIPSILAATA